jgi:hypothetical protein
LQHISDRLLEGYARKAWPVPFLYVRYNNVGAGPASARVVSDFYFDSGSSQKGVHQDFHADRLTACNVKRFIWSLRRPVNQHVGRVSDIDKIAYGIEIAQDDPPRGLSGFHRGNLVRNMSGKMSRL